MSRYLLTVFVLFAASLPGQRPKTAEQALERFEQVHAQNEGSRRRPASDLGRFADASVTRVLLAEIERAESESYLQTIVRSLGGCARPEPEGVTAALQKVMANASNPRLCDQAARSLAVQGAAGVLLLGEVLAANELGMLRTAACRGLGEVTSETARDFLITAVARGTNRARIAPLEALAEYQGDPAVDALRVSLAGDKDYAVAAVAVEQLARHGFPAVAKLALQLSRRLSAKAGAQHHAAILHGLLRQEDARRVEPKHYEAIQVHAARAQAAFGKRLWPLWSGVLVDPEFVAFLGQKGARHKRPAERRVVAQALALVPPSAWPAATGMLVGLLTDGDDAVVRTAAMSLARFGRKLAMPPLLALIASGRDDGRSAAALAIDVMCHDDAGWHGLLLGHSQDRSPALSATALRLLTRCEGKLETKALDAAAKGLEHKLWPVRAAAIELVIGLRMKAGVPLLIARFDHERARLHQDLAEALEELTGLRFADGKAWRSWWKQEGAGFAIAPPRKSNDRRDRGAARRGARGTAKGGTGATYWNLPVYSDRVVFVVDSSGSMRAPFGTGSTRLGEAKRQLGLVLGQLPAKAKANIIAFHTETNAWADKLQTLSSRRRKTGTAFAQDLASRGATNVHAGLRLAFADREVDTIFLLTDGRPSAGEIIDWQDLADEVARWNIGRGIRIHAVAIGESSRLLERLAEESGGNYTVAR